VGDGAMLMNSEVNTAVRYGAKAVWVILNDACYGMVDAGMRAQGFVPVETAIPQVDFSLVARGMGADGCVVTREEDVEAALRTAMSADGPYVVDVRVDPSVPGPWLKRIQNLILQGAKGAAA
jgi:acetolactate synthase-1/2/3 large subunit